MDTQSSQANTIRRRMNDLVMAEMFLLQATIESATAIGDGIQAIGRNLNGQSDEQELGSLLEHTVDQAIEPYTSRYRYFRDLLQSEDRAA